MNCNQVQDSFFDIIAASHSSANFAEASAHLAACADCAQRLASLKQTMAAMDEWKAPEPSPYFNTRFQARLAELKREEGSSAGSATAWWRRPAFGMPLWRPLAGGALAVVLALAAGLYQRPNRTTTLASNGKHATDISAVNDLQKLDKNEDLYSDFELLDDLKTDNTQTRSTKSSASGAEL